MTDEDAAVEAWISSQAAVDDAIIQGPLLSLSGHPRKGRGYADLEEHVDAPTWEGVKEVSAGAVFIFITIASLITVIIDPKMIAIALPASVLAALLLSAIRGGRRGRQRRRGGRIRPGEEAWWTGGA